MFKNRLMNVDNFKKKAVKIFKKNLYLQIKSKTYF